MATTDKEFFYIKLICALLFGTLAGISTFFIGIFISMIRDSPETLLSYLFCSFYMASVVSIGFMIIPRVEVKN